MDIIISNSSGVPIYEQIEEQIKSQIMMGELVEGDALPSMRLLAKELKISIITTKRAYEDLERDGFIESVTGKGSFVKGVNSDMVKENMMFAIQELALYLDTHKDDLEALELYQAYQQMYHKGMMEYQKEHRPLTHEMPCNGMNYNWIQDPWPWEYAANKEG